MFDHWLRAWFGRRLLPSRSGRSAAAQKHRRRPVVSLEALEDRLLLSAAALLPTVTPAYHLVQHGSSAAPQGSATPTGLQPGQVRQAYGINQISFGGVAGDGSGQTIAIVDAYDDPNIASDLHQFDVQFGLSDPVFNKVDQTGGTNYPTAGGGWTEEISLDVEWAHAIAPGASILLVEANDATFTNLNAAVDYARNQPGVVAVSMSYGTNEWSGETAYDSFYTTPSGHAGVTFLAASGDWGKPGIYEAMSPNVVGVGGTTLKLDAANNYLSEAGWSSSGGGISPYESQPSYQSGVVTQSTTQRTNPDVAFVGGTAVAIYDSYDGGSSTPWFGVYGTSLSTPCWAGLVAIADQGRSLLGQGSLDGLSQTLPALYQLPASDYHDITSGNNGYAAGAGYDLVTGRGTPIAYLLESDLVQPPHATDIWTGAGPDANWSDPLNWSAGTAPVAGDILIFGAGASQTTTTNDLAAGTSFDSIRFTGSGYTINGNDVTLTNSLDATSATGNNTFNLNTTLAGAAFYAGSSSTNLTDGGNINTAGYTLQVGGGPGTVTLNGVVSGSGGVSDINTANLVLAGSNTYSGTTTLGGGAVLQLASNSALGTGTFAITGGTLKASGGAVSESNAATLAGNVTIGGSNALTLTGAITLTGPATLNVTNTATTTLSGTIGQSGGTYGLTKTGTGLLVLSGSNTYGGNTTLSAGTLALGSNSAVGTGTLVLTGGTLQASGGAVSLVNALSLAGNVTFAGTSNLTFTGATTLTSSHTLTINNTTTFSGGIGETVASVLTKAGTGVLILSAPDTYSGGTILSGGTLQLGDPNALGNGSLTVSGGTLQGNGSGLSLANAVTLGGSFAVGGASDLTFTGAMTLTSNRTVTVTNTGTTTFASAIGQSGGTYGLTKSGSGLLVLSGSNTYGGTTTLNNGTLAVTNSNALGTGTLLFNGGILKASGGPVALANAVSVAASSTISGTQNLTFTGAATLTGNRTLTVTNAGTTTFSGGIGETVSSVLTKAGTGVLVLSAPDTYSGGTVLSAGTLQLGDPNALGTGTLTISTGTTLQGNGSALSLANAVTLGGSFTVGGSSDLTFTGAMTLTGSRTVTVTNTGTTTFAGAIGQSGGTWGLTKSGSGLLVLSGSNTYGGTTTLSSGTLALANSSALGTGTLSLSGGTLQASGGPVSVANAVTLAGDVTLGGNSDLTLAGNLTLTGSRTLTVTNTGTTTFAGVLGGTSGYTLTMAGSSVLVLSGANTFKGTTAVNGGTLLVNGSLAGPTTVGAGGTLGGTGTAQAVTVASGGTLLPGPGGSGTGILSTGNLKLNSGATFSVALNGTVAGSNYSQVNVTGTINLTGSTLSVTLGYTPAVGDSFVLIKNGGSGAVTGTFSGLPEGATFSQNGMTFKISYVGGSGKDVTLTRTA
jgi:autotransporter-associated beta strand protein